MVDMPKKTLKERLQNALSKFAGWGEVQQYMDQTSKQVRVLEEQIKQVENRANPAGNGYTIEIPVSEITPEDPTPQSEEQSLDDFFNLSPKEEAAEMAEPERIREKIRQMQRARKAREEPKPKYHARDFARGIARAGFQAPFTAFAYAVPEGTPKDFYNYTSEKLGSLADMGKSYFCRAKEAVKSIGAKKRLSKIRQQIENVPKDKNSRIKEQDYKTRLGKGTAWKKFGRGIGFMIKLPFEITDRIAPPLSLASAFSRFNESDAFYTPAKIAIAAPGTAALAYYELRALADVGISTHDSLSKSLYLATSHFDALKDIVSHWDTTDKYLLAGLVAFNLAALAKKKIFD